MSRSLERMRAGKMNVGWYWVFGLFGLFTVLFVGGAVLRVFGY